MPLYVEIDSAGRPLVVQKDRRSSPRPVASIQGCWRIDDEWWREQAISRLYYTVVLDDGALLTIYHDLVADAWFKQWSRHAADLTPNPFPAREGATPCAASNQGSPLPVPGRGRERGPLAASQRVRLPPPPSELPHDYAPAYVELHLHTCYSFLEGASQPRELVARAVQLGYQALAATDHDGLYGAMEFAQACVTAGIQPITGVEITLRHGLCDASSGPVHLTLLAENSRGYANICRLLTEAHRSSPRTDVALDPAFLAGHTEGVIALSGCRSGEIVRLLDAGRFDDALHATGSLADLFGRNNTFIELQYNFVQGDTYRIARLTELAAQLGLETAATGNVHYHDRTRHRLQDSLVAIKHRTTLEASHLLRRPNSEFFLRSPQEAATVFAAHPRAIANTVLIGERCKGFNLADRDQLGYEFPDFTRKTGERRASADEALAGYCWARFDQRYPPDCTDPGLIQKAREQLDEELRLIARHGLGGFFLIYRDLQELATEVAREVRGAGTVRGGSGLPPGRGRGSSVSSLVCYLIGLSHVDPVKNRLFFHRFLNEDLQAVPDIDLDFARDIREQLILRVYERYGHDHTALVCSFATYHLRSAVRDLGKVLGLPPAALDKLARLSEGGKANSIRTELDRLPEFQGQAEGPLWAYLIELAEQVGGFPRHVSQHVGGMIISSRPLIELVPVQPAAMEGRFICQWDKDSCDDARFIKIDFLALGMLSLVEECLELVWQNGGGKIDFSDLTYDDPAVYDAICRGDTIGLFQIESRAQIQMLPRTLPRSLEDLAVQVAIVRPGPIVGGAVNPYVRRREMLLRNPTYQPRADHPLLDELLRDTLGVVLYQDQVLEVAKAIGGFSAGQANQLRRAMSRRRSHTAMERFREAFLAGAREKGITPKEALPIFEKLLAFSEFGFPKSHAYAFAVLAYQSAWLRYKYPAEYYAALLNNQPMGFYSPHVLVGDAKRHDIQVLRVAINSSGVRCTPGDGHVLLGLTSVRGIGEHLAGAIVDERTANGPYRSLNDLLRRSGLAYAAAENLISVGALSELGLGRRELLWQLGLLRPGSEGTRPASMERLETVRLEAPHGNAKGPKQPRSRKGRQLALALPIEQDMVDLQDMNDWERAAADYSLMELSPAYHPLALLRQQLPPYILSAERLKTASDGSRGRTAGLVVCRQRPGTAKGFLFLLLEDETGLINVVVHPDLYNARRSVVRAEPYLYVEGVVQQRSGTLNLLADRIDPLAEIIRGTGGGATDRKGRQPSPLAGMGGNRTASPMHMHVSLPPPRLRHPYPGNPHDPREVDVTQAGEPEPAQVPEPRTLHLATPTSHDFH